MNIFIEECEKTLSFEEYVLQEVGQDSDSDTFYANNIINVCPLLEIDQPSCVDYESWVKEYEEEYLPSCEKKYKWLNISLAALLGILVIYKLNK